MRIASSPSTTPSLLCGEAGRILHDNCCLAERVRELARCSTRHLRSVLRELSRPVADGEGLKKCSPAFCGGLFMVDAISVMEREDVLLASSGGIADKALEPRRDFS